ncbi:hypothetical protein [Vibrio campbellii]|uniref:hypothetical protein n=1 Tax=Vibrio campbellii TaxID=680 RepID=UPI00210C2542|nr:hypothetical protein [Vibrio campbellii]UTZ44565.1 hypothetical protein HB764_25225 [Vibrio campbellii]
MIENVRSTYQITIDALTAERKKLVKSAERYKAQLEHPAFKAIELREAIPKELAKLEAGTRAYTKYLNETQAKLDQYQKELKAYEKRDYIKVNNKYMKCQLEIDSIDHEIAMIKWKMAR